MGRISPGSKGCVKSAPANHPSLLAVRRSGQTFSNPPADFGFELEDNLITSLSNNWREHSVLVIL